MSKETVRLFSQTPRTAGTTTTLPLVGEVTFDKELNYIDVPEELAEPLQARQFGITLLTADVVKEKKEIEERGKYKTKIKGVLSQESLNSLMSSFEELKEGRSEEEQEYLTLLIEDLKVIGVSKSNELKEAEQMLRKLSEKQLKDLLKSYPEAETKEFKSKSSIIDFLKKHWKN